MNKYALILPLVVLSFFLGYFSSYPQREDNYLIVIVASALTAAFTLALGYLLFINNKKGE